MATKTKDNYIDIVNDQKSVKTMQDFIDFYKITEITAEQLFDDNIESIFSAMSVADKIAYSAEKGLTRELEISDLEYTMNLPRFCVIRVYYSNIVRDNVIYITNVISEGIDYKAWADEQLRNITESSGYEANPVSNNYVKMAPNVRVAGWFKARENIYTDSPEVVSPLEDISRYVISLSTNVSVNGGNFTLTLPYIPANTVQASEGEDARVLKISETDYYKARFSNGNFQTVNYFEWLISPNDILFLRFERLAMEEQTREGIPEVKLANGVWDMIALVDTVTVNADAKNNNINVQVTGRDLMKLLIDDGSYFFSVAVQANAETMFPNCVGIETTKYGDTNNDLMNIGKAIDRIRSIGQGAILPFQDMQQTVGTVLKKTITLLSNISIAPNDIFNEWGDKRTTRTHYTTQFNNSKEKVVNDADE